MIKVERRQRNESQRKRGRLAAACVLFAIGFLLLAPDPHDHGDAGSLGGLLRLLLPDSHHTHNPHESEDESQPEAKASCPIHFWHQVAATGLVVVFLLQFFLGALQHISSYATTFCVADLGSVHSRSPPVFPS